MSDKKQEFNDTVDAINLSVGQGKFDYFPERETTRKKTRPVSSFRKKDLLEPELVAVRKMANLKPIPYVMRQCLHCLSKFESEGANNRICKECKLEWSTQ